jgi:hypothetical protein
MKKTKQPTETKDRASISAIASELRCDRRTLGQALRNASVTPDAAGRYCRECARLARELYAFRDTTSEREIIEQWLHRELSNL